MRGYFTLWVNRFIDEIHRIVKRKLCLYLSLGQPVIPETVKASSDVRFSRPRSPEEQALVAGAKFMGFSFESRGLVGTARVRVKRSELIRRYANNVTSPNALLEFKILDLLE
ncbi:hypothetical protein PsorP6_011293 [Peronosclerospora sorghi]|uniref:Uncharacterized protein n=1 Tax=Peronosclerospora sorghi TaxID=230839 RepID=A0ACC0WJ59_9STRA|nr:hypothetical protein PsorP6_011293 [Peronosclerospora sorghi]